MHTSAECQKQAAAKIKLAESVHDIRRVNRLMSAANAWLILAHGIRTLELNAKARKIALAAK